MYNNVKNKSIASKPTLTKQRGSQSVKSIPVEKPIMTDLDVSNVQVKELVMSSDLKMKSYNQLRKQKEDRQEKYKENKSNLMKSQERQWMTSRGSKDFIDFNDKARAKLKSYFRSLDTDGSQSIGVDELQNPLISLGIAQTVTEVQRIVDSVDEDGSGQIEFDEFLSIIKSKHGSNSGIVDFFKDLTDGKLAGGKISNKLPFLHVISTIRRQKMLQGIMAAEGEKKDEGMKILNNYTKLLALEKRKNQTQETEENAYDENEEEDQTDKQKNYQTLNMQKNASK
jgi:hypothetical protein